MQPRITIATPGNIYLEALKDLYRTPPEGSIHAAGPNAVIALKAVMQRYINRQKEAVYGVFSHSLNHIELTKECVALLDKGDITGALKKVNDIPDLKTGGDFSMMLTTFLSVFPEYSEHITNQDIKNSLGQDLWSDTTYEWLRTFMVSHRNGKDGHHHEQLRQVAAVVPADMADEFADFLLAQLAVTDRHEAYRTGLYRGWAALALSELEKKLTPTKKQAISEELLKQLPDAQHDYSIIGLCHALTHLCHDEAKLSSVAASLHNYATGRLPTQQDVFNSTNQTVSTYMPYVFTCLHRLEKYYSDVTRSSLMQMFIKPENLFCMRQGVLELHEWLSEADLKVFFDNLNQHDKFSALTTLHFGWINSVKSKSALRINDAYFKAIQTAEVELKQPTNNTPFMDHFGIIASQGKELKDKGKREIVILLAKPLAAQSKLGLSARARTEIHAALQTAHHWFNEKDMGQVVPTLKSSMYTPYENDNTARISAAKTLFSFNYPTNQLTSADIRSFVNELLIDLHLGETPETLDALREYARHASSQQLPDLMMRLAFMDTNGAKLLLTEVREDYLARVAAEKSLSLEAEQTATLKQAAGQ